MIFFRAKSRNANSIQTRASGKSRKSSKNRRKHERKMYSTKAGSAYEDIGLIAALHAVILRLYETAPEVGRLTRALAVNNLCAETAKQLQSEMDRALGLVQAREPRIWIGASVQPTQESDNVFGPDATTADIIQKSKQAQEYLPAYELLETQLRFPPIKPVKINDYKLEIF